MRKIQINGAARAAIRGQAIHGRTFHETAVQVGPDAWDVELEDYTVEALDDWRERRGFESYSDVLLWLVSNQRGPN